MEPTRALVLDVEGLIAHPDVARANAELSARWPGMTWQAVDQVRNLPAGYQDWLAYSVGAMDGDDYWRNVLAGLERPTDDVSVAHLRGVLRRVWWARVDREVLAIAGRVRSAGYRLALLSNSAPEHEPTISQLVPLVDVSHFSHRTGRRKPDQAAYLAVAEELELPVGSCLFVDDKARNVDAAVRAGMSAFVFTSAPDLERELVGRGLLAVVEGTC